MAKRKNTNIKKFKSNTKGGGAKTNETGLTFEQFVENKFVRDLEDAGYVVDGNKIIKDGRLYATRYSKHSLYNKLCKENGINWKDKISGQKFPDDAILVHDTNTLHIIEKKYQETSGSKDEVIECPLFKVFVYTELLKDLDIKIKFTFVLNDWYRVENNKKYKDHYRFHSTIGICHFFNELPISHLGL